MPTFGGAQDQPGVGSEVKAILILWGTSDSSLEGIQFRNTILDYNHKKTIKRPKTQVDHCRENHRRLQQLNHIFGSGIKLRFRVALYIFRDRDPFELSIAWFQHSRLLISEVLCNYAHRYLLTSSVLNSPMMLQSRALIRWISHHVGYSERSFLGGLDACANYKRRIRDLAMGRKNLVFSNLLGPLWIPSSLPLFLGHRRHLRFLAV